MAATFVLLPGAGGAGEVHWRETATELAGRGHTALPVDFPGADPAAGLPEYAAITDEVIGERDGVVLVAQCTVLPVRCLVRLGDHKLL